MTTSPQALLVGTTACLWGFVMASSPRISAAYNAAQEESITDRIAVANARNAEAVRTVVLDCTRVEDFRERPGDQERARRQMTGVIEDQMRRAVEQAKARGANARQLERTQRPYLEQLAAVDANMRVIQLNRNIKFARTSSIDFANTRARYDDADLRDLQRLGAENNLGPAQMLSLTRSMSTILKPDRNTSLMPQAGFVATVRSGGRGPGQRFDADEERLALGIIPRRVFDGALQLEVPHPEGVRGEVEVIGRNRASGREEVRFFVRPEFGYRLSRWVAYSPPGEVAETFRAWDFRKTDGVFVPFRTELRRSIRDLGDYYVQ